MNRRPLVSIVIPAYNQGSFVAETIDSVLAQAYPHREILVLDDGSTDDTPHVIQRYAARVIATRHANMGENPTVNRGFSMARGDVVCVVNADDPLLPGAIEAGVECLERDPAAMAAYPDWAEIDSSGSVTRTFRLPDYDLRSMLVGFNVAVGPGVFIRRSAIETIGNRNPSLRYTGDLDFWFRVAVHGGLRHVPRILATHRVHLEAASSSARGRRMAAEVVRLVAATIQNPDIPRELKDLRLHLLAKAHSVARHYCGGDRMATWRHQILSKLYRRLAKWSGRPRPAESRAPEVAAVTCPIHYGDMFPRRPSSEAVA